jgi:inner membrane protein
VDNVCHTLVGAALAEAGLKRRTALGSATLMIAANFPDIDVIAVPLGHSLGFRRGMTHGVPAHVVLPVVLTGLMLLWHRWRGGVRPDARALLVLSTIGILTHPFLDWMNTYGMRWLMPLDTRWWYADTLFIVDPWIWLALGSGVWLSRRRATPGPARWAVGLVAAYIGAMGSLAVRANGAVHDVLVARGITADTVVVEPVAANPLRRRVIHHWEGAYHLSTYSLIGRSLSEPWLSIPLNVDHPSVAKANATPAGREYHTWTRLPYYVIQEAGDTTWVTLADARYTLDGRSTWAVMRVAVPR